MVFMSESTYIWSKDAYIRDGVMDLPGKNRNDGDFLVFLPRDRIRLGKLGTWKIEVDMKAKQERTGLLSLCQPEHVQGKQHMLQNMALLFLMCDPQCV